MDTQTDKRVKAEIVYALRGPNKHGIGANLGWIASKVKVREEMKRELHDMMVSNTFDSYLPRLVYSAFKLFPNHTEDDEIQRRSYLQTEIKKLKRRCDKKHLETIRELEALASAA